MSHVGINVRIIRHVQNLCVRDECLHINQIKTNHQPNGHSNDDGNLHNDRIFVFVLFVGLFGL